MTPEEIFNLFEGICPECGKEVSLLKAAGTEQFRNEQAHEFPLSKYLFWNQVPGQPIGELTYICPDGHQTSVAQNAWGDWS